VTVDSAQALRIASANMEEGCLDPDGSTVRQERTITALAAWSPDVVCVQEISARRDQRRLRAHLWATANALAMIPLLGSEGGISGNHPGILVHPGRLAILDDGPPPRGHGHDPAWCEALLQVRPGGPAIRVYSVHLPPRSAAEQLIHAQRLAATVAQHAGPAIAAGDWNCYAPADQITAALTGLPPHLRPARMRPRPGRPLAPNYDVHDAMAAVGLKDAAAGLDPGRRDPTGLTPTGINGGGRVDRFYVTPELWESGAVRSYAQQDGGGSDHHMIMIAIGLRQLAGAAAQHQDSGHDSAGQRGTPGARDRAPPAAGEPLAGGRRPAVGQALRPRAGPAAEPSRLPRLLAAVLPPTRWPGSAPAPAGRTRSRPR
jgi:endonuclease/exonuclease/phosphatase family metal-dependent hydrolase